jgi:uncharacterized protein YcbK (DUF882 family)
MEAKLLTPDYGSIRGWSSEFADIFPDFSRKEFACKCGCGFDGIDIKVVHACQQLRSYLQVPLRINSGCRCEKHNARVGSKSTNHIRGKAVDIWCKLGHKVLFEEAKKLYSLKRLQDMDLILLEGSWVHMDCNGQRKHGIFQTL